MYNNISEQVWDTIYSFLQGVKGLHIKDYKQTRCFVEEFGMYCVQAVNGACFHLIMGIGVKFTSGIRNGRIAAFGLT